jgi:hypothetical protein
VQPPCNSRRANLPPAQPDAWWAMMDAPVVATFLEYHPNPTWLADSAGQPVYANQADEHVTEEDRVPFYSVARYAEQSFAVSSSSAFRQK